MHSPPRSILLIADPILPVPPPLYGGIERVVHFLAEGLAARGSKVTLVCHPASTCQVSKIPFAEHDIDRKSRFKNLRMLIRHLLQERYDVVHSFSHVDMALPLWPFRQPVIQSFQAMPNWAAFSRRVRYIPKQNLYFTTCGHHMVEKFEGIAPTCGIHNGIILDQFDYRSQVAPDAPLVFLGRIEPIKGTHHAIQIARESGRKLIIAGNRSSDPKLDRYFIEQVNRSLTTRSASSVRLMTSRRMSC